MSVIVSKRKISEMQFYKSARDLRKNITKMTEQLFSDESKFTHSRSLAYYLHAKILDDMSHMMDSMIRANEIFPTSLEELEERKRLQNRAIGYCEMVYQDLEYIVDLHPQKVKQVIVLVDELDYVKKLLRRWKKSTNRLRKDIVDKTIQEIEKELRQQIYIKIMKEG